jgi:hypothetical protein
MKNSRRVGKQRLGAARAVIATGLPIGVSAEFSRLAGSDRAPALFVDGCWQ